MENTLIEEIFVDFILEKLGPSKEKEEIINKIFQTIKHILLEALEEDQEFLDIKIIPFGSFPSKVYISESDLDITIIFLNKEEKTPYNFDYEFLNKVLQKMQNALENNKDISAVSLIFADVKVIKCKIEEIPIDISICNYAGLCKLKFMHILFLLI